MVFFDPKWKENGIFHSQGIGLEIDGCKLGANPSLVRFKMLGKHQFPETINGATNNQTPGAQHENPGK